MRYFKFLIRKFSREQRGFFAADLCYFGLEKYSGRPKNKITMASHSNPKEKLICISCRYETDYLGTYAKPPACPHCKNLLSFKESGPVRLNESANDSWMNRILLGIAVLFIIFSAGFMLRHFKTFDHRELVENQVRAGENFYGGPSRSKVPKEWLKMPYSFENYWSRKFQSREDAMINEEHWYVYKGTRNGEIELEYRYADSKGKKGEQSFSLKLAGNTAYLDVPAIPYVKKSLKSRLKLVQDPSGNQIRVTLQ